MPEAFQRLKCERTRTRVRPEQVLQRYGSTLESDVGLPAAKYSDSPLVLTRVRTSRSLTLMGKRLANKILNVSSLVK